MTQSSRYPAPVFVSFSHACWTCSYVQCWERFLTDCDCQNYATSNSSQSASDCNGKAPRSASQLGVSNRMANENRSIRFLQANHRF